MKNSELSTQQKLQLQSKKNQMIGVSPKHVLTGGYGTPVYGQAIVASGQAAYGGLINDVMAANFHVLRKPGIVFISASQKGELDFVDVGGSSTTEELMIPFMNYFTTDGVRPTVFTDYETAKKEFTGAPPASFTQLLSSDKIMAAHFEVVRKDNLQSMSIDLELTDTSVAAVAPAAPEQYRVVKGYTSNANRGSLTVLTMNFQSRFKQLITPDATSFTFSGEEQTQILQAVGQPAPLVDRTGTDAGFSIGFQATNCIVYVTLIPYTMGDIANVLGFAAMSQSTTAHQLGSLG